MGASIKESNKNQGDHDVLSRSTQKKKGLLARAGGFLLRTMGKVVVAGIGFSGLFLYQPLRDATDHVKAWWNETPEQKDRRIEHEETQDSILNNLENTMEKTAEEVNQTSSADFEAIDIDTYGTDIDPELFDNSASETVANVDVSGVDVSDVLSQISSPSVDPDIMGSLAENSMQVADVGWMGKALELASNFTSPEFTQNLIDVGGSVKQVAQAVAPSYFS